MIGPSSSIATQSPGCRPASTNGLSSGQSSRSEGMAYTRTGISYPSGRRDCVSAGLSGAVVRRCPGRGTAICSSVYSPRQSAVCFRKTFHDAHCVQRPEGIMTRYLAPLTLALAACGPLSNSAIERDFENSMANHRREWVAQNRAQLSDPVAAAIVRGEVLVGMTPMQAMQAWNSWGPPQTVNRTVTAAGESAQLVFSRGGLYPRYRYLYVEGGRVTAIQF